MMRKKSFSAAFVRFDRLNGVAYPLTNDFPVSLHYFSERGFPLIHGGRCIDGLPT
jgi:hypothetical protein